MNTEITGIIITFGIALLIAFPLGKYISNVFAGNKTLLDFLNPVENAIYRFCGIDQKQELNWKQNMKALLTINLVWFIYAFVLLLTQGSLFLNPDGNPSQTSD